MKSIVALLIVAVLTGGIVFLAMGGFSSKNGELVKNGSGELKTESDFRDKVAVLKRDRQKLLNAIERLKLNKSKTLQELTDMGVTSSEKIDRENKKIVYALNSLKGWNKEIKTLGNQVANYDEAIQSIVAMLDKLERERINQAVGLSEEQLLDLRKIVVNLDEKLEINQNDILLDEEDGRMLDEEMEAISGGAN